MTTIDKPGIYEGFPVEAYFADPCPTPSLNQTVAKLLLERSPLHAKFAHPRLAVAGLFDGEEEEGPQKYDKAQAIGSAAHALILGRGKALAVGEFDAWTTKEAKEFKRLALEDGEEPILRKHYRRAEVLSASVKAQIAEHQSRDCFAGPGKTEVVIAWQEDGLWFRSMIDFLSADLRRCDDLKTTRTSAAPASVCYQMDDMGWGVQAAMWERGLNALDPDNAGRRRYRFVCVEQDPPFALTVNEICEAELTLGRRKLNAAVEIWKRCLSSGVWPGYPQTTQYPSTPPYRAGQWEERELELRAAR